MKSEGSSRFNSTNYSIMKKKFENNSRVHHVENRIDRQPTGRSKTLFAIQLLDSIQLYREQRKE